MNTPWHPALAAYDRELPLLHALRDEYLAYVRERLEVANAGVPADIAKRVTVEICTPDDNDPGAEITVRGDGPASGLQVQLWSSADCGGVPGKYVWAMLLPKALPPELGDARQALGAARQAASMIATEALEGAPVQANSFAGFDLVQWGQLDLGDPEFGARLARLVPSLARALAAAADALVAPRQAGVP